MGDEAFGPWQPLDLNEVVGLFKGWSTRWWITGGVALELHLRRSWRTHDDSDVSILRADARNLPMLLAGWDIHIAAAGVLAPWNEPVLAVQADQNNVWCRKAANEPWCLDVTVSDGDQASWIYRRDPSIRVPWADAVLRTERGIPYLAPELQLLFKSMNNREKDDRDAAEVIPALSAKRRQRLGHLLPDDHPWRALLES